MDDELQELRRHQYHRSRIPALDAVETFVADGAPPNPELAELRRRSGFSRWYPVPGGHRVVVLYEGGGFNAERFTFRKGQWDHEHCKRCVVRIPALTPCWVSNDESYIILCDDCYQHVHPRADEAG